MNTIASSPSTANLASALLALSSQTQPAGESPDGVPVLTLPPGADTLTLSGSQTSSASNDLTSQEIEQQNLLSALADPPAAYAANQSAISLMSSDPASAVAAQSGQTAQSVLSLA